MLQGYQLSQEPEVPQEVLFAAPTGGGFFLDLMGLHVKRFARHTSMLLAICIITSIAGHGLIITLFDRLSPFSLGTAISEPATVQVELTGSKSAKTVIPPPASTKRKETSRPVDTGTPPTATDIPVPATEPAEHRQPSAAAEQPSVAAPPDPGQTVQPDVFTLTAEHILPVQQERLTYQISLAGMPVGTAHLEATNRQGELRIISSIRSNSAISAFYPVNDSTDTRLIKGRYLLTRIRLHEGFFVSDTGFNLMFHEKKIFWVDRLKNRYSNEPLESMDTLDFISGFYFLRLQPLKIGTTITLRLYDGDTTVLVPVEVLRQEQLALPGLRSVETLVIKPTFSKSGFFKNNHDLLIWLTNDENRVPVRIESTTPIGRIVAELVASERILPAAAQEPVSSIVPADKMQYR
jgi:hypothetical protein